MILNLSWGTQWQISSRGGRRGGQRERGESHNSSNRGEEEARGEEARAEASHSQEEGVAEKRPRRESESFSPTSSGFLKLVTSEAVVFCDSLWEAEPHQVSAGEEMTKRH